MRVTMVETVCENNDERIDSDSDTIEIIVGKGMVVAVLADDPNYESTVVIRQLSNQKIV
jgi:hypothetical protein